MYLFYRSIKKNRKQILFVIKIFVIIVFLYLLLVRIGVLCLDKNQISSFFESNKSDFSDIINYASVRKDESPNFFRNNNEFMLIDLLSVKGIGDTDIAIKTLKILILGNYELIHISPIKEDNKVEFRTANLLLSPGEPYALIYSEENLSGDSYIDDYTGEVKYRMTYQSLGDNWYYVYREI